MTWVAMSLCLETVPCAEAGTRGVTFVDRAYCAHVYVCVCACASLVTQTYR